MTMTPNEPTTNTVLDGGAVVIWAMSLAQILPSIAAFLSIVWFALRIAESDTVQQLLGPWAWIKPKDKKNGASED